MRRLRRARRELRTVSSARGRKPWNHAPLQVTTRHHILCAGSTGGGAEALSNRIPGADEPAKNRPPRGKSPAAAVVVQDGVRLAFALFLGRLHLFPNRGGDDHLAVACSRPRLVDHRDPASFDLDLPHCSPCGNLVVCGVEEIRELVAFQLVRSRVGVHRVEQLDALLIRHLGGALRLRALVAQDYAHYPPVRSEGDVAVGRLAATLSDFTGISHFLALADQLPRPVKLAFGRRRSERESEEQSTGEYRGFFHDVSFPGIRAHARATCYTPWLAACRTANLQCSASPRTSNPGPEVLSSAPTPRERRR